jgi:hypothetical protein
MDVPCPRCKSTDLQKVSLAWEEVPYPCDKRAQFHGVLVASGGVATCRICRNPLAHSLSFEEFVVQLPVATAASKRLLAARRQNRLARRTFRAAS